MMNVRLERESSAPSSSAPMKMASSLTAAVSVEKKFDSACVTRKKTTIRRNGCENKVVAAMILKGEHRRGYARLARTVFQLFSI